jgi:hypothetical protein
MPKDEAGAMWRNFDATRRDRITKLMRAWLLAKKRNRDQAGALVAELERWAAWHRRPPGARESDTELHSPFARNASHPRRVTTPLAGAVGATRRGLGARRRGSIAKAPPSSAATRSYGRPFHLLQLSHSSIAIAQHGVQPAKRLRMKRRQRVVTSLARTHGGDLRVPFVPQSITSAVRV